MALNHLYTKYFGLMTKEQGRLNLSTMQFQRFMNIIHIEGVLFGLHKAKEANKGRQEYHKYDILINRIPRGSASGVA